MSGTQQAKKRLIINIVSNILATFIAGLAGLWLTPYLIKNLGLAVYGMVPLMTSVTQYFSLFAVLLTSAVGRYVSLYIGKNDIEKSIVYFNSSVLGLSIFALGTAIVTVVMAISLANIFQIPPEILNDTRWLFVFIVISAVLSAFSCPFMVATFITHRFYWDNIFKILGKLIQIGLIFAAFSLFSPMLKYIGLSYVCMALCSFFGAYFLCNKFTPFLVINQKYYNWTALKEMLGMGGWMIIDQLGTMLYLNSDIIIINLFLAPEQLGRYSAVFQWVVLLRLLAPALSSVFAPVAYDFIAKENYAGLSYHTQRVIKFIGLILALPTGLLCGLSRPLLQRWLGESFVDLNSLMWMLIFPQVLFLAINPLYNINRGMNKVQVPALFTVAGGVLNILLSVLLVCWTDWGIYAVGLATTFSYGVRSIFFAPVYTSTCLRGKFYWFILPVIPSVFAVGIISALAYGLSTQFALPSYGSLILAGMVISLLYLPICLWILMNQSDRKLVYSLVFGGK